MHDTNQVEQSYQDPELPEAYNAPAILDSVLCFLCSTPCSLAECDSAWPGRANGADGSPSFTTGRHFFFQKLGSQAKTHTLSPIMLRDWMV